MSTTFREIIFNSINSFAFPLLIIFVVILFIGFGYWTYQKFSPNIFKSVPFNDVANNAYEIEGYDKTAEMFQGHEYDWLSVTGKNVILDIPDTYFYMDPLLVTILKEKLPELAV